MPLSSLRPISIHNACEHNLRNVSIDLPRNKLIVVTGVSGSGKSSLVFDVLFREAESRYLGSLSSAARQFMGRFRKPDVERIDGLTPAIALDQKPPSPNPRSTVGTITGIYDSLRLLFARIGTPPEEVSLPLSRSLFSFNSPEGACPACKGLGVEDFLDPELLISDSTRTLRQGALVITAPNGYIIYSQVTLDVLDQVCRSEGFHIDIPWKQLTPEQKHVVLYGSDKIEIPYGKHPLESRMRWSGITAKPREMGYYKGIIPVMEGILKRDRNRNILRFVRSGQCSVCHGARLNPRALSVRVHGYDIARLSSLQLDELRDVLGSVPFTDKELGVARPVIAQVSRQVEILSRLGLSHLPANRDSTSLDAGESVRLRLSGLAGLELSGLTCIFDEPSVGLHPSETGQLLGILREIRDKGNTVIVVEHDEAFMRHCDWLVDIGPGPGIHGGKILFSGTPEDAARLPESEVRKSRTLSFLAGLEPIPLPAVKRNDAGMIRIEGASARNLKDIDAGFKLQTINVVTGVSGAGKSTLTDHILGAFLKNRVHNGNEEVGEVKAIRGWEQVGKLITIDRSPIGRTPRSNPATYTGLFDPIRDLYARQPEAVARGYGKSRFSFNTPGGRCESCEGAGYQQIGMHFMGTVEVPCESCEGRRFDEQTLGILFRGRSISDVLGMTVSGAMAFFTGEETILKYLKILSDLGLGYLTLGQRSSTLSGGEAQRVRLAAELAKPPSASTLYIMDEPTTGLHQADIPVLLNAMHGLILQGHTVIVTEHHPAVIAAAGHVIELGPGSGRNGGRLLFSGPPEKMVQCQESSTAKFLSEYRILNNEYRSAKFSPSGIPAEPSNLSTGLPFNIQTSLINIQYSIFCKGVFTNNLKNIDVEIPHGKITVITGVSGSGKSSLAFDTIHAESRNRFLEISSPYVRSRLCMKERPDFEEITGLTPTFAVGQQPAGRTMRSTVGTMTGIYDHYRLLFSRIGIRDAGYGIRDHMNPGISTESVDRNHPSRIPHPVSSLFSFNHHLGACPACDGLGQLIVCNPEKLITHPARPLMAGAMDGTKTGKFYGDPYGQYMATLLAAGERHGIDFRLPWDDLSREAKEIALNGTGNEQYDVRWLFVRGARTGEHHFTGAWKGLSGLVNEEYARKHADHRGEGMMKLMKREPCRVCHGSRLRKKALEYEIGGMNIAALSALTVERSTAFFNDLMNTTPDAAFSAVSGPLAGEILGRLACLSDLGLSYLTIDRPAQTLSAGESRRVRLASQIGSGLTGITYVLDEPTLGLHPNDTAKMMKVIRSLRESGNTVLVVEHDPEVILSADHVIDIGPGAGKNGGRVLAAGTPEEIMADPASVTGPYLRQHAGGMTERPKGLPDAGARKTRRQPGPGIRIGHAFANNLKGFDLTIPSGGIVAITGVSGSGKSTLLSEVIHASWENGRPTGCESIEGFDLFRQVVMVQQHSGFNSPLSTPATFTGIFDRIRDLFASCDDAKRAGFRKNAFSFLDREGRCPVCEGTGQIRISMDFLPDVVTVCDACNGKRYQSGILVCRYNGLDIASVLDLTVTEATGFFSGEKAIIRIFGTLEKAGLGYLELGQRLDSLSGGESQRLALAAALTDQTKGPVLYLFEEPSSGLHFRDVGHLAGLFDSLADQGNTLVIIEHDPVLIARSDHIIELGPEGGDRGGFIMSCGPA